LSFAFGAALVTSVVSAAPASAHAELVRITPRANAQLTTAPAKVVVQLNEPVSKSFATVVVTSADGVNVVRGTPTFSGGTVTQALRPGLLSGIYRIAYRVSSNDGHPVTGESRFTLTLISTAGPATSSAPAATPDRPAPSLPGAAASSAEDSTAGSDSLLTRFAVPVSWSVALLVIGVGLLSWERRRR